MFLRTQIYSVPMGLVKTNSHGHHGHHVLEMGSCSGTVFSRVFLRYVIFNMLSPLQDGLFLPAFDGCLSSKRLPHVPVSQREQRRRW